MNKEKMTVSLVSDYRVRVKNCDTFFAYQAIYQELEDRFGMSMADALDILRNNPDVVLQVMAKYGA